ncbi:pyridoxal phosphate-dependent decarboxylase family protein [Methylophaga sp. OBS3]|uniref:pyridoxal phosphate-dependent decarboxylase family protein n=1 Tax=Methylophaga sp. OBS3 TaxID=2991934 RepID=UPI002251192F|nr:aminotransferase class V-fold PLP-dependent enzyme [Methylophaga sp. OBS3]MCX4189925.1 aminotransferase class V-fold PLP-dependent enzyme [Methylophaga sp. OBS3]
MTKTFFDGLVDELGLVLNGETKSLCQQLIDETVQKPFTQTAHMSGSLYPAALAGQVLATLHQGNLLSAANFPTLRQVEADTLAEMAALFSFPFGHFTTGGSMGNLEALAKAKARYPNLNTVYVSDSCHYSINKACLFLGLSLIQIPTDSDYRIDLQALQQACEAEKPLAIIANAGSTSGGHIDPLVNIAEIAKQYQCWFHIDAAWGGFMALLDVTAISDAGLYADSLCFDPHKSLGQPRPCGLLFYKQPLAKVTSNAEYLSEAPDTRLIGSRGGEYFLSLWLTLQHHGLCEIKIDLKRKIEESQQLMALLQGKVGHLIYGETGIICFQHNKNLQPPIDEQVLSQTTLNKQPYYRIVFADRHARAEDVFMRLAPYL